MEFFFLGIFRNYWMNIHKQQIQASMSPSLSEINMQISETNQQFLRQVRYF